MINKRLGFAIIFFVMLFSFVNYASSQEQLVEDVQGDADKIMSLTEKLGAFTDEGKRDFLMNQWKELFLKNKVISSIDKFLKNFSLIFLILFGEKYDFSLTLFFIILLWIFLFLSIGSILKNFSTFNPAISYILTFAIVVISAQIKILKKIAEFFVNVIFLSEGIWRWVSFIIFLFVLVFFFTLIKKISNSIKTKKEILLKEEQKLDQKVLHTTVEGIKEANEDV